MEQRIDFFPSILISYGGEEILAKVLQRFRIKRLLLRLTDKTDQKEHQHDLQHSQEKRDDRQVIIEGKKLLAQPKIVETMEHPRGQDAHLHHG